MAQKSLEVSDLPEELIHKIMSHCDPRAAVSFGATCKRLLGMFERQLNDALIMDAYYPGISQPGIKYYLQVLVDLKKSLLVLADVKFKTDMKTALQKGSLENLNSTLEFKIVRIQSCKLSSGEFAKLKIFFPEAVEFQFLDDVLYDKDSYSMDEKTPSTSEDVDKLTKVTFSSFAKKIDFAKVHRILNYLLPNGSNSYDNYYTITREKLA